MRIRCSLSKEADGQARESGRDQMSKKKKKEVWRDSEHSGRLWSLCLETTVESRGLGRILWTARKEEEPRGGGHDRISCEWQKQEGDISLPHFPTVVELECVRQWSKSVRAFIHGIKLQGVTHTRVIDSVWRFNFIIGWTFDATVTFIICLVKVHSEVEVILSE